LSSPPRRSCERRGPDRRTHASPVALRAQGDESNLGIFHTDVHLFVRIVAINGIVDEIS
jgi:hypothetical protein